MWLYHGDGRVVLRQAPSDLCIEEYGNNGTYTFQGKESGVRPSGVNHIEGEYVDRRASLVRD